MYFYTSSFTWIEISCVELNYMNEKFVDENFHHTIYMNEIFPHFVDENFTTLTTWAESLPCVGYLIGYLTSTTWKTALWLFSTAA